MKKPVVKTEDLTFFESYRSLCKVTDAGLMLKYPKPGYQMLKMPLIKSQAVELSCFEYIGFHNTRDIEYRDNRHKTVGFFKDDGRFDYVCDRPWKYTERIGQYKQVLSPDLSCYTDMSVEEQWINTFTNRLIGAYWQSCGLTVIPTVSWSDERSYESCFSGLEYGSVIAVSTLGTKKTETAQHNFITGFRELCRYIEPELIICYCTPYPAMYESAKVFAVKHEGKVAARLARQRPLPGQLTMANW